MKRLALVALALVFSIPLEASSKAKIPDFSNAMRVNGRFSIAHACPVAPDLVLTSAHVVDPKPLDMDAPLVGLRFQNLRGDAYGFLTPLTASAEVDIALLRPAFNVPHFTRATKPPIKGETLYFLGYDYRKPSVAFNPVVVSGTVINVIAGMIVADAEAEPGASGGCVLNEAGEVVGLVTGRMGMDNSDYVTVFDSVWGDWVNKLLNRAADIKALEEKMKAEGQ